MIKIAALAALAVSSFTPALANAQGHPGSAYSVPMVCTVYDSGDTYSNFRQTPNGNVITTVLGNGYQVGTPDAETFDSLGRRWVLFNGLGWIIGSNLACDLLN